MKVDVLGVVANYGEIEAQDVAACLGLSPPAAAMALLRACRGGLLSRSGANGGVGFRYALTDKGWRRLSYLEGQTRPPLRSQPLTRSPVSQGALMRTRKSYSGVYHCLQCVYEVALRDEASLRCDDCGGRLFEGELPDEDDWEDEDDG